MIRVAGLAALLLAAAGCSRVRIPETPGVEVGRMRSLPLRALPAAEGGTGRAFAIVLTGDGPSGGTGKRVAADLAAHGIPSVIWQSLRYYWSPRTPEQAARDLDAVIRHYGEAWGREKVVLVGYSMGADVLPFLINRLPEDTKARVGGVALLALAHDAVFEFRMEQWWRTSQRASVRHAAGGGEAGGTSGALRVGAGGRQGGVPHHGDGAADGDRAGGRAPLRGRPSAAAAGGARAGGTGQRAACRLARTKIAQGTRRPSTVGGDVPHQTRLEVQMKKLLVLAAAALLAAAPAAAQQVESPSGDQPAVQQVATPQEDSREQAAPSIFVSREQIQQRVAAMEAERNGENAQMNQSFWYLVAAIALGVLVALLLID